MEEMNAMNFESVSEKIKQLVAAVLIAVPLMFVPMSVSDDFFYAPKANALLVFAFLYLLLLILSYKQIKKLITSDKINLWLAIYFILLLISLFFARDMSLAIQGKPFRKEGFITLCAYGLMFLAARCTGTLSDRIVKLVLGSGFLIACYGIMQFFGIDPFLRDSIRESWTVVFSTMGNPNFLGAYLVLILPLSVHEYIINKNKWALIVYTAIVVCLLMTMTRGSWIGAILSMIVYFGFLWINRTRYPDTFRRSVHIVIQGAILILGFNLLTQGILSVRFSTIADDASLLLNGGIGSEKAGSVRVFIWKRVLELIRLRPWFGYGIENLYIPFMNTYVVDIMAMFNKIVIIDKAHNEYLNIAVSTGIPSLITYLVFVSLCVRNALHKLKVDPILLPITASVIGYLTQAFFNISVVSVAYIFWIFLGILAGNQIRKVI